MKEEFNNLITKYGIKNAIIFLELPEPEGELKQLYISTGKKENKQLEEEMGDLLYHSMRLSEFFQKIYKIAFGKIYNEVSFKSKGFTDFDFLKNLKKD